jgi:indolepyruvate decarboxylase
VVEILTRLTAARSPVILVDVEVRRFGLEDQVMELARRLGLPVATCFMGRGLLVDMDPPILGTYMGLAGQPEVTQAVESSDCLLMLGVIVSDTNFAVSERRIDIRKAILACDGQVSMAYHTYPELPLSHLVAALVARVPPAGRRHGGPRPPSFPRGMPADAQPITPADISSAINDMMDAHGRLPIACDIGDALFTAMEIDHTALVAPGYYATMGFGVPAGLGVQAASGQRPLIMVGDGAFQMTGWELGNCRRYGWDPIVLVINNASWEMLRAFQPGSAFNDLDDWGFAAMAPGLGGDGIRVHTRAEFAAALHSAWTTRGRFQLIEVMVARGAMSTTLQRFVAAVRRLHRASPES